MSEAREDLLLEIMGTLIAFDIPVNEVKSSVFLVLDKYEIEPRTTAIAICEDDAIARYCNRFLQAKKVKGCTERTIHLYRYELRRFFQFIPKDPRSIEADDIRRWLAVKETRDKVSKTMLKNIMRVLSSFYTWMQDNDHITSNPVKKVEAIRHKPHKEKAFDDMQVERLRAECRNARETAIVETLLSTGCRVSELVSIKIADINKQESGIEVFGKGEKYRMVYLNAKAMISIERYLAERNDNNPFLFPKGISVAEIHTGGKEQHTWYRNGEYVEETDSADKGTIEKIVRDIGKRAGVEKTHPHRFRKTCATNALKSGMPLELVSKMLGHESVETTQIYLDIREEDLKQAHKKYVR